MAALSSDEAFQSVLAVTDSQVRKNKILIRFGPSGKMRFVIDEPSLKDALAAPNISEATFREIFNGEIGPLLEAVTQRAIDQYLQPPSPLIPEPETDPAARAKRQALLRERAVVVEKSLFNSELRGRYLVKTLSMHPRLRRYTWEVSRKLQLSTKEEERHGPYTTLSFETIRPEPAVGIFSWLSFLAPESFGRTEYTTFDCDEGDLDDLIQTLQDAKAALSDARKGTQ